MKDWWQQQFPKGRQTVTITDAQNKPVEIAYGKKGRGQPLVFVHGLGVWSVTWHNSIDFFSQYYQVICIDTKGYGFSDKPAYLDDVGYKVIELKRIIEAVCDQPAVVVTESLWGAITLGVAEEDSHLISRLIVIGATIFPRRLPTLGLKIMARLPMGLIRWFDRYRIAKRIAPLIRLGLRQTRSQVVVRHRIPDEDIYWQAYPYVEFPNAIIRLILDVKQAQIEIKKLQRQEDCILGDIEKGLRKITCPVLVLWGQKDRWFPPDEAKELHRRLPNSQLAIVPNCGHDVTADAPDEANEIMLNFLVD
jgi:pimeloyl-ACP methyl ester carboxylesterase